jgi:hypothetical protein
MRGRDRWRYQERRLQGAGDGPPRTTGIWDDLATLDVAQGIVLGAGTGLLFSVLALIIAAVVVVLRLVRAPGTVAADLPDLARALAWISAAYVGGFATGGALVGLVNRPGLGPLRVPLSAFVVGASIYGVVGLAMHFFDPDSPASLGVVAGMSCTLGVLWAIIAVIAEWWKGRRMRRARR